jgi:hypothetical protein
MKCKEMQRKIDQCKKKKTKDEYREWYTKGILFTKKKGGNIEGLSNWNGHLARLQWCMASSMIHRKTALQHAWIMC